MSRYEHLSDEDLEKNIINHSGTIQQALIAEWNRRQLLKVQERVTCVHAEIEKVKDGLKPLEKIERDGAETARLTRWVLAVAVVTLVVMVAIEIVKARHSRSPIELPSDSSNTPTSTQIPTGSEPDVIHSTEGLTLSAPSTIFSKIDAPTQEITNRLLQTNAQEILSPVDQAVITNSARSLKP